MFPQTSRRSVYYSRFFCMTKNATTQSTATNAKIPNPTTYTRVTVSLGVVAGRVSDMTFDAATDFSYSSIQLNEYSSGG